MGKRGVRGSVLGDLFVRGWLLIGLIVTTVFDTGIVGTGIAFAQSPFQPPALPSRESGISLSTLSNHLGQVGSSAPNDPLNKVWQEEATLRSIAAVSEDRLIAVGDRGVVLVSEDAGRKWVRQPSLTSVSLHDVQFSGDNGWIVGGWIGKHTGSSYSVLLFSNDGGRQWQVLPSDGLPRLIGLAVQGHRLIAWGDYSVRLGSSVFESIDGGLSWRPAVSGLTHANAVATNEEGNILAIDRLGKCVVHGRAPQPLSEPTSPLTTAVAAGAGWLAAGDNGQLAYSRDGISWSDLRLPLNRSLQDLCCWNTIARYGNDLWLAGFPGSVIAHSSDGGLNWRVYGTGQNLPLNRICFIDRNRGWAVGAQGTILSTRDGGKSWFPQRNQPTRTSLLSIVSHSACVPWPALVAAVWDNRHCTAVVCLQHDEPITFADFRPNKQTVNMQAASQLGLTGYSVCHHHPEDPQSHIAKLALQILVWRPDVVLSANPPDPYSESSLAPLIGEAIQMAESEEFDKLINQLHITRWPVKKWAAITDSKRCEYSEQSQRVLRQSGLAIWDILLCLPEEDLSRCHQLDMRTLWTRSLNRTSKTELMGGIAKHPEAQLVEDITGLGNYQLVMGRVHRQRLINELAKADSILLADEAWAKELRFFAQSLPIRESSESLIQLAENLFEQRRYGRGQLVLDWLVRLPSTSEDARRWARWRLLQLMGSQEWQTWVRAEMTSQDTTNIPVNHVATTTADSPAPNSHPVRSIPWSQTPFETNELYGIDDLEPNSIRTGGVITASAEQITEKVGSLKQVAHQSSSVTWLAMAESVFQEDPGLRYRPDVMMQLASHYRRLEETQMMTGVLNELLRQAQLVSWNQAAQQELALLQDPLTPRKWSIRAKYTEAPPRLDGDFMESTWLSESVMQLTGLRESRAATSIRWAYDEDYLYLAIQCPYPSAIEAAELVRHRYRDADLMGLDHIVLTLDTDRDYSTAIELAIAENGLTYERCAGLREYNPKWHVKVNSMSTQWCAEVAIPISEICLSGIQPTTVWAVSARRFSPTNGVQSWSQIRTHRPILEASGILVFQ
jgi:photosystem II stability/assembly factor-like uncharacterized protein